MYVCIHISLLWLLKLNSVPATQVWALMLTQLIEIPIILYNKKDSNAEARTASSDIHFVRSLVFFSHRTFSAGALVV